jgi:hypothetical protein
MSNHKKPDVLRDIEAYLLRYLSFPEPGYPFAMALWCAATYLWPHFDAFPYLVITSSTKRSGKTRLSELLSFIASNPRNMAAMTSATLFRMIRDENPTIFIDEAESLSSETADTMRTVLNVGYRRGQMIPRMSNGEVEEWPAYCPKVFILIGDVFDTLRDRSIIVTMRRGAAPQRFLYEPAKADGQEIGERLSERLLEAKNTILDAYADPDGLPFLQDRDEEIWMPIFAIARVLCPDRMDELTCVAVDMCTDKTAEARRHTSLEMEAAERDATNTEYGERLLRDLATVMPKGKTIKGMWTTDALAALFALPTGPWRKLRGTGLDAHDMSNLLSPFGVAPKLIRTGKKVARGYTRVDVDRALKQLDH